MGSCASKPACQDSHGSSGTAVGWDEMTPSSHHAPEGEEDEENEDVLRDRLEGVPGSDWSYMVGKYKVMDSTAALFHSKSGSRENEPIGLMGGSINAVLNDVKSNEDGEKTAVSTSSDHGQVLKIRRSTSTSCYQNDENDNMMQLCHCPSISRRATEQYRPNFSNHNKESVSDSSRPKEISDYQRFNFYPSNYCFVNQVVHHRLVSSTTKQKTKQPGTVRLMNLGNTCFMNAALQCLSNCTPLTDYFLGIQWEDEMNFGNALGHNGVMAAAYGRLLETLWYSNSSYVHDPSEFKHTVGRIMPMFSGFKQHDVQEFVAFMLDAIHEDLNRVKGTKPYIPDSEWREEENQETTSRRAWKGYLHRNRSIIVDLFQGQLRSQLRCLRCGYVSIKFDPFMYLSVPLPKMATKNKHITLLQCLECFCEEETLDAKERWYCPMCKCPVPSAKKLDIWKLPPVLIIHFKRFAYDTRKSRCRNNAKVSFPISSLNLGHLAQSSQRDPSDYDLFAVANHHGRMLSSGHYTAQALNRVTNHWYEFNDSHVELISQSSVSSASEKAYVLFYSKMRPDLGGGGSETGFKWIFNSKRGSSSNTHSSCHSHSNRELGIIRKQSLSAPQDWPHA